MTIQSSSIDVTKITSGFQPQNYQDVTITASTVNRAILPYLIQILPKINIKDGTPLQPIVQAKIVEAQKTPKNPQNPTAIAARAIEEVFKDTPKILESLNRIPKGDWDDIRVVAQKTAINLEDIVDPKKRAQLIATYPPQAKETRAPKPDPLDNVSQAQDYSEVTLPESIEWHGGLRGQLTLASQVVAGINMADLEPELKLTGA